MHIILYFLLFFFNLKLKHEGFKFSDIAFPILGKHQGDRTVHKRFDFSTAEILAHKNGFLCETHYAITRDGYILGLHRIKTTHSFPNENLPVILIIPGFLLSSDGLLFRGNNKDLPYFLANSGYDVWLYNTRGNTYSKNHLYLNPDKDKEFWNFSFHEMAIYDLPAVIDYILELTNQKTLSVINHSMGSAITFVLCSKKPKYNKKINLIISMAPAVIVDPKTLSYLTRSLIDIIPKVERILKERNSYEILPQSDGYEKIYNSLCNGKIKKKMCQKLLYEVIGPDYELFNRSIINSDNGEFLRYTPAGTSIKTLKQISQVILGDFSENNYKKEKYSRHPYDLSKVTTPTVLCFGENDKLTPGKGVRKLARKLPNLKEIRRYRDFNHMDFLWKTHAVDFIFKDFLIIFEKYL